MQRGQKPVSRKQLTELKDPLVLGFLDHGVCVCVLSGVCTALKNDITCCNPNAAAAVIVASLVTVNAHNKRRKQHWHNTFPIFDSFTCSLNSNLLELSHVLTYRYVFNRSCDPVKS